VKPNRETLPIWCVHCERKVFKLIGELKAHDVTACPLCGELTKVTPEFLAVNSAAMNEADRCAIGVGPLCCTIIRANAVLTKGIGDFDCVTPFFTTRRLDLVKVSLNVSVPAVLRPVKLT
jgi:hypothetical protein